MACRAVFLTGGLFVAAGLLSAQAPPGERVPIRDPEELAALRLPRDARNVYRWSGADRDGVPSKNAAAPESPETWGTAPGYTTVMGYELTGLHHIFDDLAREIDKTYCIEYAGVYPALEAVAQLQLPDGADLAQFQFWAYDEEPNYGLTFNVFESCQGVGFDPPTVTLLASADTFGSAGSYFGFKPLNNYKVNNRDCGYSVRVIFIQPDVECRSDRLSVQKVQVSWIRQVSPAPAVAAFADVPTGHPQFQFIEALAKSGITGGCGGGNFCPNSPLTRGQMAVFLAKGLGLAWP